MFLSWSLRSNDETGWKFNDSTLRSATKTLWKNHFMKAEPIHSYTKSKTNNVKVYKDAWIVGENGYKNRVLAASGFFVAVRWRSMRSLRFLAPVDLKDELLRQTSAFLLKGMLLCL